MVPDLTDREGRAVALGEALGRGGEGQVHALTQAPDQVAKVLFAKSQDARRFEKIQAMIDAPPVGAYERVEGFPVLTWPKAILYGPRRKPVGYVMARVRPHEFVPFYRVTSYARRRELGGTPVTWDRLVLLAARLCHILRILHRFGYAVGDLNDRNVLVSRRYTPLFMDTDSFQVPKGRGGHYPCVVGDQSYWPPEHLAIDYATFEGSRIGGDRYALGVLLFQLFMNGHRPYQSRGSAVDHLESLVEKTRDGRYPWAKPRRGVLEPPASAPDYQALPKAIRHLFERCFVDGHRHPKRRPSADEWYEVLVRLQKRGFTKCAKEAAHVYGADEPACPWCKDPNDPFGAARPRPPPKRPPPRLVRVKPKEAPPPPPPRPVVAPKRKVFAQRKAAAALHSRSRASVPGPRTKRAERNRRGPQAAQRAFWRIGVALLCLSPLLWIGLLEVGEVGRWVIVAVMALWVAAGAAFAARRFLARTSLARVLAGSIAFGIALAALANLTLGWLWLDYANAAVAAALGIAVFVKLERRPVRAASASTSRLLNASLGVGTSYLPAAALWAATHV